MRLAMLVVLGSILSAPAAWATMVDEDAERCVIARINEDRRRAGLPPVRRDERLRSLARYHSADMVLAGFVAPSSPTYGPVAQRAAERSAEGDVSRVAVHVAIGAEPLAAGTVSLEARDVRLGVGVVEDGGRYFVTQVAVADPLPAGYAAPRHEVAPSAWSAHVARLFRGLVAGDRARVVVVPAVGRRL